MAAPNIIWTPVRVFAAQAGEATALPAAASFITVPGLPMQGQIPRLVEFMLDPSTPPSTANAPTSVVFKIYRAMNQADTQRHLLYPWTIATTDITNNEAPTLILEGYAPLYYARISFNGGAAPAFTGTLLARAVE